MIEMFKNLKLIYKMKKFITFIAIGLAFACSKIEPINTNPVVFGTTGVSSKAIIENTVFPDADFGVFADVNAVGEALTPEGTDFMNNDKYTNASGTVTAETTKYWIPDTQTQFYAYYPFGTVTSYLLHVDANHQDDSCVDVMWAKPAIVTYNSGEDAPGTVNLDFKHQLAFIEFQAKEGTIVSGVKINSLKFTLNKEGDFNVKTAAWSNIGVSGDYDFSATSLTNTYATIGKVLVIPQNVAAITINYTATILGYTYANKTRTIPVSKLGVASWEKGKKYIYKISIDSSDVISFGVSVSNWDNGTDTVIY